MAFKIAFRFDRDSYDRDTWSSDNEMIKTTLLATLASLGISTTRVFAPSRNSIKAIFPNETELNKVLNNSKKFIDHRFTPKLSMALRAARTVFCSGFDTAILDTYTKDEIVSHLQSKGWGIAGVYILRNGRSMKIEFINQSQATKFINDVSTSIGQ